MGHAGSLEYYGLMAGLALIGVGIYGIFRPADQAGRNQAHIDSGEERYFEERRSWEYYGRPATDPNAIRRGGWMSAIAGVLLILVNSPVSIFHWS